MARLALKEARRSWELIVTDLLAKEKQRVVAQWIDFEIVE